MIVYFANRSMEITGQATTYLPEGLRIEEDKKTEDVETGVSSFSCNISYNTENRSTVEKLAEAGNYILRSHNDKNEFYTIIESEVSDEKRVISIYAEDAGLDLINDLAEAYEATEAHTIEWYVKMWIEKAGFEIGTNEIPDLTRTLKWESESTVTERLNSLATEFDNAELDFSFKIDKMAVTNKYLNIYKKRGQDVGTVLRKNIDFESLVITKSVANLATALKATGSTVNSDDDSTSKQVTLDGYTYDDGDFYVDGDTLKSRNALEKWSRYSWEKKTGDYDGHITKSYSYETESQSELFNRTLEQLKAICDIEVNYEITVNELPENVGLGDVVTLVDEEGGLYLSARILKLETSETDQTDKATIGDYLIKEGGISEKVQYLASEFAKLSESRTLYTWVVYADDSSGSGISLDSTGKKYMGVCTNRLKEDADLTNPSLYKWTLVEGQKGEDGKSVTGMVEWYLVSPLYEGVTVETSGWSTTVQTMTATNKYLWNYEVINYSDGSSQTLEPKVIGAYGETGTSAPSIVKMTREYYMSTSSTELSGGSWGPNLPEWSSGLYLWTRWNTQWSEPNPTVYTYSDPTLDSAFNAINISASEANAKADEARTEANNAKNEVSNINKELDTANGEIAALKNNLETVTQTMETDYAKTQDLTKVQSTLESSINQNAATIETVVSRVTTVETDTSAAQTAADNAAKAAKDANDALDAARGNYATLKERVDASDEEIDAAKTAADNAADAATAAKDAADAAKSYADGLFDTVTENTDSKITTSANSIKLEVNQTITSVKQNAAKSIVNEYSLSNSETQYDSYTSWSTTAPSHVEGKYMWMRTKTIYVDIDISPVYSDPVCISGAKGDKGDKGDKGNDGDNGVSPTVSLTKTDGVTTITITDADGTHTQTVNDGVNGTPGAAGDDGKTTYFHVKYSNDGGNTFTGNSGEDVGDWLGSYSDTTKADSTSVGSYTWVKIKGETGDDGYTPVKGVDYFDGTNGTSVTVSSIMYKAGTSSTSPPSGTWSDSVVSVSEGEYLWTKTTFSDGKIAYSIAKQGEKGDDGYTPVKGVDYFDGTNGRGIASTTITYAVSDSNTSAPSSGWNDTVPETDANKPYLWTKTYVTYTSGDPTTSYSVSSTLNGVDVGDRNLLKSSGGTITASAYKINTYMFGNETPSQGDSCIIVVKATLGSGSTTLTGISAYDSTEVFSLVSSDKTDGVYKKAFTWSGNTVPVGNENAYLTINQNGAVESTVEWVKLVKGNTTSDVWTAAPEDIDTVEDRLTEDIVKINNDYSAFVNDLKIIGSRVESTEDWQTENGKAITSKLSKVTEALINKTTGNIEFNFETMEESINNNAAAIQEQQSWVHVVNDETEGASVVIGDSDSSMNAVFTRDALKFKNGETTIAEYANDGLEVENITTRNQILFEGHGWAMRPGKANSEGKYNLNDVWIGG